MNKSSLYSLNEKEDAWKEWTKNNKNNNKKWKTRNNIHNKSRANKSERLEIINNSNEPTPAPNNNNLMVL